ncbi:MAG: hypothetical protein WC627_13205 [Legionella sp.]|jgi:hypothetical protein
MKDTNVDNQDAKTNNIGDTHCNTNGVYNSLDVTCTAEDLDRPSSFMSLSASYMNQWIFTSPTQSDKVFLIDLRIGL